MSDLLICSMEMPKDGFITITVTSDGRVVGNSKKENGKFEYLDNEDIAKVVPVPPHWRLIDANALWAEINKICDRRDAGIITDLTCLQQLLSAVRHAPTVIPAEPCNNLSKPCKEEGE